ncbi:ABC transporter permease [Paludibaculum fermentans]|uniref:ABC transporter permease n=1 Tax=Paludibaculum fermentans TaxID=1473598 RepID=UPI003EBEC8C9
MKAYLAYIKSTLLLTTRDRLVVFFNFLFPLIFFVAFGEGFGARTSTGAMSQVLTMVLVIGVLGSGFFGAGMRATVERESGILRRFKVAPITPAPIVTAGLVTGWVLFLPTVIFFILIARLRYGMPFPEHIFSLLVMVSAGVLAFRSLGAIIASVVNSMAESQIIIQLMYLPMLMLSGATVPLNIMPDWLQIVAQFLPSTHLYLGMQGILVRNESLAQNLTSVGSLVLTAIIGSVLSVKLFRWEKEDKFKPSAKFWVLGVLAPFIVMGVWQSQSRSNLKKTEILARQMRRTQNWLIRDARIFVGDGRVLESGSILIRNGRIEEIFEGKSPDAKSLNAEAIDASGKTVLPGLIDSGVQLMLPGTGAPDMQQDRMVKAMERELAAYLYCGVTAVRSAPDPLGLAPGIQARLATGELLGAELSLGSNPATPSLVAGEIASGRTDILKDTLLQQVVRPQTMEILRRMAQGRTPAADAKLPAPSFPLPPASLSGLPLLPHGPALHRELKLWVASGISTKEALQAATFTAAKAIGASGRLGLVQPGYEATLLIVEGNPLDDISATERVWFVLFKGEHVRRDDLFENYDKEKSK